jgi:hypothetical protein
VAISTFYFPYLFFSADLSDLNGRESRESEFWAQIAAA